MDDMSGRVGSLWTIAVDDWNQSSIPRPLGESQCSLVSTSEESKFWWVFHCSWLEWVPKNTWQKLARRFERGFINYHNIWMRRHGTAILRGHFSRTKGEGVGPIHLPVPLSKSYEVVGVICDKKEGGPFIIINWFHFSFPPKKTDII